MCVMPPQSKSLDSCKLLFLQWIDYITDLKYIVIHICIGVINCLIGRLVEIGEVLNLVRNGNGLKLVSFIGS